MSRLLFRIQNRRIHERSAVSVSGLETPRANPGPPDLSEDAGLPHTISEKTHKHDRFIDSRPESERREANKSEVSFFGPSSSRALASRSASFNSPPHEPYILYNPKLFPTNRPMRSHPFGKTFPDAAAVTSL